MPPSLPQTEPGPPRGGLLADLVRLARPVQWAKGVFVLVGPLYGLADGKPIDTPLGVWAIVGAFFAFALSASGCYVFNDLRDAQADRNHPRKKHRPIAAGRVGRSTAVAFGAALLASGALCTLLVPAMVGTVHARALLAAAVGLYVVNVLGYTAFFKRAVVLDVMSLSLGFVLRVLGGCAAVGIEPSGWLLNVTFFVAMFLAFGKRLGERAVLGDAAAASRSLLGPEGYTPDLLRMAVVVTGVATLLSYSDYVQAQSVRYMLGFNLLWITILPATYGLLRALVLLERGRYDDPTELATHDRAFQASVFVFGVVTGGLMVLSRAGVIGAGP